jgi:hypothetical protein
MSFLDFRPEPTDDSARRAPTSMLNEFPSELPTPMPDGIDSITRRLRSPSEASESADPAETPAPAAVVGRRMGPVGPMLLLAAAVVVLGVAGFFAWPSLIGAATSLRASLTSPAVETLNPAVAEPDATAAVDSPAAAPAKGSPSTTARPAGQNAAGAAQSPARVASQAQPEPVIEIAPLVAGGAPEPAAVVTNDSAPLGEPVRLVESALVAETPRVPEVYSSADADVQPPKIVSADLPRGIGGGLPVRTEAVELLVNVDGSVAHVQLRTAEPRMLDAMLLSRAKMWQFEPARLEGRPVPYRLVLAWQVSDR